MFHRANVMVLFSVLALMHFASPVAAEPQFQIRIVDSDGGLRMRSSPDLTAVILRVIPDGSEVDLLDEKPELLVISGKTGKWTKVGTKDRPGEGWVFGGFLSDSRALLKKLAASYDAIERVEPGNAPTWLRLTESLIYSGYGGIVEANWYCLVAEVARDGKLYTIVGNTDRKPTKAEIEWLAADAKAKEELSIVAVAPDTIELGNTTFKRRK